MFMSIFSKIQSNYFKQFCSKAFPSILHSSFIVFLSLGAMGFSGNTLFAADEATSNQQQIPVLTVNINQATAEEISDVLTGVGIKKAMVIVSHRDKVGAFKSIDDLLQVKGIGPATLEKNRHKLKL